MDRGADAGRSNLSQVLDRPPQVGQGQAVLEPPASDRAVCEQAIYTALCSASGQGYRVIATSSGLPAWECGEMVRMAPAVGGLCMDTPEAVGISFFPLTNGRFAVLHTCHAGKEPTGRGGRRTYTRIIVVEPGGLRRFRNNPFALVRATQSIGGLVVDMTADVTLPQLIIAPEWGLSNQAFETAVGLVSERWVAHLMEKLLAGESIAVSAGAGAIALAELVFLALPLPLRSTVSFSVGVPFAVGRPHRFVVMSNVSPQMRDRIAGTEYALVDVAADADTAPGAVHPWARTVQRFIETRRTTALINMLADRFSDGDMQALDRIGQLCLALESAASRDLENLVDVAMPYVGANAALPLERELARQVVRLVRHRFASLISHADGQHLSAVWKRMLAAEPESPEAARFVEESAALAVTRMSCLEPVEAMRMILESRESTCVGHAANDLEYARQTVSTCAAGWVEQTAADTLGAALPVFEDWCRQYPDDAAAAESLARLNARLAESEPEAAEAEEPVAVEASAGCSEE